MISIHHPRAHHKRSWDLTTYCWSFVCLYCIAHVSHATSSFFQKLVDLFFIDLYFVVRWLVGANISLRSEPAAFSYLNPPFSFKGEHEFILRGWKSTCWSPSLRRWLFPHVDEDVLEARYPRLAKTYFEWVDIYYNAFMRLECYLYWSGSVFSIIEGLALQGTIIVHRWGNT
jgi:hypothetical protein